MPASAALLMALTAIPLEVAATDALDPEAPVSVEFGCSVAWAELSVGVPLPSCASAVAAEFPEGQMVSTSPMTPLRLSLRPERPTAHTCEVSGAFATSNIELSCGTTLHLARTSVRSPHPSVAA